MKMYMPFILIAGLVGTMYVAQETNFSVSDVRDTFRPSGRQQEGWSLWGLEGNGRSESRKASRSRDGRRTSDPASDGWDVHTRWPSRAGVADGLPVIPVFPSSMARGPRLPEAPRLPTWPTKVGRAPRAPGRARAPVAPRKVARGARLPRPVSVTVRKVNK